MILAWVPMLADRPAPPESTPEPVSKRSSTDAHKFATRPRQIAVPGLFALPPKLMVRDPEELFHIATVKR